MNINPLFAVDSYKIEHYKMYPKNTTKIYSNFTPRSSKHLSYRDGVEYKKIVFFGLQGFIKWFLINVWDREFFYHSKEYVVDQYKTVIGNHLSIDPSEVDTKHIEELHDLGYLPIEIKALEEGSKSDIRIPVLTITNTRPNFGWLTNYLETVISAEMWKPITIATIIDQYYLLFKKYAEDTGVSLDFVKFQGHCFSSRGMSGIHDDAASNAAFLLSFYGTDSISSVQYLRDYYNASYENIIAKSVPATEHSIMTLYAALDEDLKKGELECFRNLIEDVYPNGIISLVSDSYDYWNVITNFATELKNVILNREGKVVFRPDTGNPYHIVCGYEFEEVDSLDYYSLIQTSSEILKNKEDGKYYRLYWEPDNSYNWKEDYTLTEISENEIKGSIELLWEIFGGTINEKGYKVLNEKVGLIYGDSITLPLASQICEGLKKKGFATSCIVFGIGSMTCQLLTRDSLGMAMKATYGEVEGKEYNIFKDPKTDSGTKKSAKGLLRVEKENDKYVLYENQTKEQENSGLLKTVFKDGILINELSLEDIRNKLEKENEYIS